MSQPAVNTRPVAADPDLTARVKELSTFTQGWDGYAAKPITGPMIDAVCRLLERLADEYGDLLLELGTETECLLPACVPVPTGAVQLEWHIGGRILELEFETPEQIRYLKWWPGHAVADAEDAYAAENLEQSAALIRWVLTGTDDA